MPVLSLACHLPHNTPNIPSRYNNEQTTKQTKAINNSYIYIYISCKCDTNRAGHFTLDAYASRPVACSSFWPHSHSHPLTATLTLTCTYRGPRPSCQATPPSVATCCSYVCHGHPPQPRTARRWTTGGSAGPHIRTSHRWSHRCATGIMKDEEKVETSMSL